MLTTLDIADLAIVLSTLDVVCLKNVSQIIAMLSQLRFPSHNVILVGNRYDERVSLDPRDAEKAVGMPFAAVVPQDDRVMIAANRGVPTIVTDPGVPFTQKVRALAKIVGARIGRVDRVTA